MMLNRLLILLGIAIIITPIVLAEGLDFSEMLQLINTFRASQGVSPPLQIDHLLTNAASVHCSNMANANNLSHTVNTQDGNVGTRASAAGFLWTYIEENIAQGQTSVQQVMTDWENSPGHRANLLGSVSWLGLAYCQSSTTTYWVQVFGQGHGSTVASISQVVKAMVQNVTPHAGTKSNVPLLPKYPKMVITPSSQMQSLQNNGGVQHNYNGDSNILLPAGGNNFISSSESRNIKQISIIMIFSLIIFSLLQ